MDCFAPLAIKARFISAISRRDAPELCMHPSPQRSEGAGNAGRSMRPQPRVQNKTKHTSKVTTVTPVSPGIPRAMVLTVSFVLSLVTGLPCHHRQRDAKHRRQLERQRRGVRTTRLRRPLHARSSFCAKASTASHTQRP
jgi:hypothetical protein